MLQVYLVENEYFYHSFKISTMNEMWLFQCDTEIGTECSQYETVCILLRSLSTLAYIRGFNLRLEFANLCKRQVAHSNQALNPQHTLQYNNYRF